VRGKWEVRRKVVKGTKVQAWMKLQVYQIPRELGV
jgi:hypothetical protein